MTIKEIIEQIGGRITLNGLASGLYDPGEKSRDTLALMASALLAVLDAKPFAAIGDEMLEEMRNGRKSGRIWSLSQLGGMEPDCLDALYVYTTPPAASVPDGWKLVPVEPTQRMIDAHTKGMISGGATRAYREMLAAAPVPGGDTE